MFRIPVIIICYVVVQIMTEIAQTSLSVLYYHTPSGAWIVHSTSLWIGSNNTSSNTIQPLITTSFTLLQRWWKQTSWTFQQHSFCRRLCLYNVCIIIIISIEFDTLIIWGNIRLQTFQQLILPDHIFTMCVNMITETIWRTDYLGKYHNVAFSTAGLCHTMFLKWLSWLNLIDYISGSVLGRWLSSVFFPVVGFKHALFLTFFYHCAHDYLDWCNNSFDSVGKWHMVVVA